MSPRPRTGQSKYAYSAKRRVLQLHDCDIVKYISSSIARIKTDIDTFSKLFRVYVRLIFYRVVNFFSPL